MASTQLSPGVVVVERDLTTVANTVVDNIGVIAGSFEKGPVEEVVDILSEKQLLQVFGKPNDQNYEFWYSASQFMLYGGSLKVIRANSASLRNAIDKATVVSANLSASDTVVSVVSSTNFSVGDHIRIDSELMTVTAVSGNDVTVVRGALSTSAASHVAGRPISLLEPITANQTTINEGGVFTASDTTLTVTTAPNLNIAVNGYIIIGNEILQVTAITANNLTVSRAQFGTTAAAHADGADVTKLVVTIDATNLNETNVTGITPPLIKNLNFYETTVESAANPWVWAARTPGTYGNSLKILMTDAGADQVLTVASPSSGVEWSFPAGASIQYSPANVSAKVYHYSVLVKLDSVGLAGTFVAGAAVTAASGAVAATVVAWDPGRRILEVTVGSSTTYFQNGQTLTGPGGATGTIVGVERRVYTHATSSALFQVNQNVSDSPTVGAARTVIILGVRAEYEDREFGDGQKWINIAPRPTTSQFINERVERMMKCTCLFSMQMVRSLEPLVQF